MANDRYNLETILAVKRELLAERRAKTPIQAVIALADMQRRPQPILNTVTNGTQIALIGQITRSDTYDPVAATLNYIREGVDAVSLFTDHSVYGRGLDDLLLVSRGVNIPVITQDYILDEYHVIESRAAGASALVLSSSVLDEATLRNTVTATQRWRMTAIVQVSNVHELEYAQTLSPHVLGIGIIGDAENCSQSIELFQQLRPHIPYNMRVMMLGCVRSLESIETIVELGVDAIMVSDELLGDPYQSAQLRDFLSQQRLG